FHLGGRHAPVRVGRDRLVGEAVLARVRAADRRTDPYLVAVDVERELIVRKRGPGGRGLSVRERRREQDGDGAGREASLEHGRSSSREPFATTAPERRSSLCDGEARPYASHAIHAGP